MGKHFLFKPNENDFDMVTLPEEWRIIILYDEYVYLDRESFGADHHKKKLISYAEKILKIKINEKNFKKVMQDVHDFFYHDKSKINISGSMVEYLGQWPLGPIGIRNGYGPIDIDDIEEVGAQTNIGSSRKIPFNKEVWGYFKSKTCGWCHWVILPGDESLVIKHLDEKYAKLVSWNHHNREKSRAQLYDKKRKYENEGWKRSLGKTFISNRFWHHDELEKLIKEIPKDDHRMRR
tara:strand:- start:1683 stop:2387 length:705 start_codon:yes stop_codon:yes gene_type:complete